MAHNHGGDPQSSERTKLILNLLTIAGETGLTTWQIQEEAHTVAASTGVADLRKFGWIIDTEYEGRNESGKKVYRYFLRGRRVGGGMTT